MSGDPRIDGLLVHWGDRLFYPRNRTKDDSAPRLTGRALHVRANHLRERVSGVVRRAPQVMVKVTGGGRGMRAIAAHFRYISKNGRIEVEDEHGAKVHGKEAVKLLVEDWRWSGSQIEEEGFRREAFNIMLSMPRGTDPLFVQRAVREFAKAEFSDHKYVMVLHDHQANPHVHLSVRAESVRGKRLNPRKADLARWREAFAEKLRGWGIDAEASRRGLRGQAMRPEALWKRKAAEDGRLQSTPRSNTSLPQQEVLDAWRGVASALAGSSASQDRALAVQVMHSLGRLRGGGPREIAAPERSP